MALEPKGPSPRWVTASDLAEYVYCPRAHWYRHHPPRGGPTARAIAARAVGADYHSQELEARVRLERWVPLWWVLVATGLLVCATAVLVLGTR